MKETHSTAAARLPPLERGLIRIILITLAAMIVIVAAGSAALLFRPRRIVSGYEIEIPVGLSPHMVPSSVAGVAVAYLDEQTPQLAAPNLHAEPQIVRVAATKASDVRAIEPGVPEASALAEPARIVWVVFGAGDFLNLRNFEWSSRGYPDYMGTIVIDDATGAILGVYPRDLPSVPRPTPQQVDQP